MRQGKQVGVALVYLGVCVPLSSCLATGKVEGFKLHTASPES